MAKAKLGPIKYLTIHCAATIQGRDHKAEEVNRWDVAKFGQVSYHHVVELDGTYKRGLDDTELGAHVGGHNSGNIGICYVGGLSGSGKPKDTRTEAQKKTLATLVKTYKSRYPNIVIRGHRDWSPDINKNGKIDSYEWLKSCPCFDVKEWLNAEVFKESGE